ncbi:MAG: carboxypeptidase-like regulatory domain-containing protein, partial [Acidobacteriota bacterium]
VGMARELREQAVPGPLHVHFDGAGGDVAAGKYTVGASLEGYAPATYDPIDIAANVSGVLLQLRSGATLKGRIVGLELDELGALELIAYSQQGGLRRGQVDFDGAYTFGSLAAGTWNVQAQVSSSGRASSLQVEVPEGALEVVKDIEFGTGFTLSGIVLDNGEPMPGIMISANSSMTHSGHGTSGADGRFRIENLPAGTYQVMATTGMGFRQVETVELSADHDLRIEIATGTIVGTVRSGVDGEPVAGASVVAERLDGSPDSLVSSRLNFGNTIQTDARGAFRLLRVQQGSWRVVVTKPGFAPGEATVSVAGEGAPTVEITLTPTEGVTFSLALQSGASVASAHVALLDPSGRQLASSIVPVIDGRARVSTVPAGTWDLVVQAGDGAATRLTVSSPGDHGSVVLPTAGTLHLRVPELEQEMMARMLLTGPDGRPFVSASAPSLTPGEWRMRAGQALITGLTPGVWSFTVEHPDGRSWSGSAAVTSGGTVEVSLP